MTKTVMGVRLRLMGWGALVSALVACSASDGGGTSSAGPDTGGGSGGFSGSETGGSGGFSGSVTGGNGNPGGSAGASGEGGFAGGGGGSAGDPPALEGNWPTYEEARQNPRSQELLVVLVEFSDTNMDDRVPNSESAWAGLMFGTDEGQVNHYWYHASLGQFQLLPASENRGTPNDGVARVKLSSPQPTDGAYWVEDQSWPREALDQLVGQVDFASFDESGDAILQNDELAVLFAFDIETSRLSGAPAQANVIFDYPITGASVTLEKFARVQWHHAAIGVPSHELAHHILGLSHAPPPTDHDLMGEGAYAVHPELGGLYDPNNRSSMRPTFLTAPQKVEAGFVTPTDVTDSVTGFELYAPSAGLAHNVVRLPVQGGYLYLENRTAWSFDQSIPFCDGDAGGLFVSDVAGYLSPFDPASIQVLANATDITVERPEFCDVYSVPGKNDSFSYGGWTITNLSEPGEIMTLDIIKDAGTSTIDHYSLDYFRTDPVSGDRVNRLVRLDPDSPVTVDFSELTDGDSTDGYFPFTLNVHYSTGEVRSVNLDATFSSNTPYVSFEKGSTFTNTGAFLEIQWVLAEFDTASTPASSAVITASHAGFSADINLVNLPAP